MSKLYITEYANLPMSSRGDVIMGGSDAGYDQTPVTISGTSAQSATFRGETRFVRIHTDVICSIAFGANPTATTNNARMAANQTEYFGITVGTKVAAISNT